MDALAILFVGGLVAIGLWSWLARSRSPRSGAVEPLGLRSAREIVEDREALEAEDLAQMLEAHNARRRRRGEPERTVDDIELLVAADVVEARRRREAYRAQRDLDDRAQRDLDDLLEATNARRRARGLTARTREEARRELSGS